MARAKALMTDFDLRIEGFARAMIVTGCGFALAMAGQVLPL